MCVMSMVFDHHYDKWRNPSPFTPAPVWPWEPTTAPERPSKTVIINQPVQTVPTKEEIEEFYELLEKARKWDEEHGEADCGSADKKRKLQELADELGIEIQFPE